MSSLHLIIHNKTYCSLKYLVFKVQVVTGYFHYGRQTRNKGQATIKINAMLFNLSKLQTFTLFHHEEFSKRCISNIGEVLLQQLMGTLISSSHSNLLDYFQPILLIQESGRLMWSLVGKNNPSKTLYSKYCQTKREIYWIYRDLSRRPWKIMLDKERDGTNTFR